jgi:hypothetical protein
MAAARTGAAWAPISASRDWISAMRWGSVAVSASAISAMRSRLPASRQRLRSPPSCTRWLWSAPLNCIGQALEGHGNGVTVE